MLRWAGQEGLKVADPRLSEPHLDPGVLTVEVRLPHKIIFQARGKRNVLPDEKSRNILRRRAGQEGLRLVIP
jgi:hypothetical protein